MTTLQILKNYPNSACADVLIAGNYQGEINKLNAYDLSVYQQENEARLRRLELQREERDRLYDKIAERSNEATIEELVEKSEIYLIRRFN